MNAAIEATTAEVQMKLSSEHLRPSGPPYRLAPGMQPTLPVVLPCPKPLAQTGGLASLLPPTPSTSFLCLQPIGRPANLSCPWPRHTHRPGGHLSLSPVLFPFTGPGQSAAVTVAGLVCTCLPCLSPSCCLNCCLCCCPNCCPSCCSEHQQRLAVAQQMPCAIRSSGPGLPCRSCQPP